MPDLVSILLINSLILVASTLGTLTGFGTSTIMMPVLIMFFPSAEALCFVTLIHWFNAINRSLIFRTGLSLELILGFGLTGIVAAYLGAKSFTMVDTQVLIKALAVFLFFYALFLVFNPKFEIKYSRSKACGFGAISGFIAGIFGMGGAIRGAFLSAFNLPKEVYLANSAFIMLLIDSSRLITYYTEKMHFNSILNLDSVPSWLTLTVYLGISILGVKLGQLIINKVPQEKFRIGIAVFLIVIALKLFL
jgi:uncharacterized protein